MENGATSEGKDPSGFLSEILGAPVTVKLNSGVVYKGTKTSPFFQQYRLMIWANQGNFSPLMAT